jgi:hypothetical protein
VHKTCVAPAILIVLYAAGCGTATEPAEADPQKPPAAAGAESAPELSACAPAEEGSPRLERKQPLEVPTALSAIVASDFDHIAVSTLRGETLCIEADWIEGTSDMALSEDGRFVSFAWYGYEEYGFKLIDRSEAGAVIETGAKPVPAPSGRLAAAVEYSESGYGSLNALGIWDIAATPVREIAIVQFPEGLTDWRFDGWAGDDCIALSATTFDRLGADGSGPDESERDRFVSRAGSGWQVQATGETGCPAP